MGPLIFFAKCIYGLLSLPFLIFSVGFFRKLFTRAQPTGYDNRGNVVPIMKELKVSYEDEIVDEPIDIGELFEKK